MAAINDIKKRIKEHLNSQNGRNGLTFIIFLGISTLFWFLMSLNDDVQRDYELPVTVVGLPDDMTIMSSHGEFPMVNVSVRDKGGNHLTRQFLNNRSLKIDFKDFNNIDNNKLTLSETQLNYALRQIFGSNATIVTQSPDSLSIAYTTFPPIKIPVIVKSHIIPKPQYTINGPLKCSSDSILLFSSTPVDNKMTAIFTDLIQLDQISDTTIVTATLSVPTGCRAVPDVVKVTVPIEPLVSKTFSIPVEPLNVPDGSTVVTFPSSVSFTCLVPMSLFNSAGYPVKAYADYEKRSDNTIPLELSLLPDNYFNGTTSPASVEYILETE